MVLPEMAGHMGGMGDATVVSRVTLGEGNGAVAWGELFTDGSVCISISYLATPDQGMGTCVPYADFDRYGITMDRGSWSLHWSVDGTVTWEGSA